MITKTIPQYLEFAQEKIEKILSYFFDCTLRKKMREKTQIFCAKP